MTICNTDGIRSCLSEKEKERYDAFCGEVDYWFNVHYADGEEIDPKARIMKDKILNLKIKKMISLRLDAARRMRQ